MIKKINIGRDFSKYPSGRYKAKGNTSGEAFCDDFLLPAINKDETIEIELDQTIGYGSSFLEEAFGGLVRKYNGNPKDLINRIKLISEDSALIKEIQDYLKQAIKNKK